MYTNTHLKEDYRAERPMDFEDGKSAILKYGVPSVTRAQFTIKVPTEDCRRAQESSPSRGRLHDIHIGPGEYQYGVEVRQGDMVHAKRSGWEGGLYPRVVVVRTACFKAAAPVDCGLCRRKGHATGDYVVEATD